MNNINNPALLVMGVIAIFILLPMGFFWSTQFTTPIFEILNFVKFWVLFLCVGATIRIFQTPIKKEIYKINEQTKEE